MVSWGVLEQSYIFMWRSMLAEGNEMSIEIHKKRPQRRKIFTRDPGSEEGSMPKANIKFDDLRKHLSSRTETNCEGIFTSISHDLLTGHQSTSRWNLIIQFKDYNCGWSSRYAIIIAVMLVSSSNTIVELRH